MKSLAISIAVVVSFLAGCASPIRADRTVFHEWPATAEKNYSFIHTAEQSNNLEHKTYEGLVRAELNRLGFVEVATAQAKLAVALQYGLAEKNTTVTEPVYINVHPTWGWRTPYYGYGSAWRGGYVSPTLWANGPHGYQQRTVTFNQARLRVEINQTDGKKLYQANVTSDGLNPTITPAMPYLVKAAFAEFPGKNGVMQRVEIRNDQ